MCVCPYAETLLFWFCSLDGLTWTSDMIITEMESYFSLLIKLAKVGVYNCSPFELRSIDCSAHQHSYTQGSFILRNCFAFMYTVKNRRWTNAKNDMFTFLNNLFLDVKKKLLRGTLGTHRDSFEFQMFIAWTFLETRCGQMHIWTLESRSRASPTPESDNKDSY